MASNPMSMMMGMMGGPPMGGPPMMSMPTMGMPAMMPGMGPMGTMGPMGMMGPMGVPPGGLAGAGGDKPKSKKKKKRRHRDDDSFAEESSHSGSSRPRSRPQSRARSRSRRPPRENERIEEVEKFLYDNRINEEAAIKVRALSPTSQRRVIARPLTGDVQNPSKVMIARVRELQSQAERMQGNDAWASWTGAMMGATPEQVNRYIQDNDLDESASRQLRSLPPHQQAEAMRWDLSGYRNPSAKFMSLANGLGPASVTPRMPMMPMFSMGMPPMMMGMRPMGGPMPGAPPPSGGAAPTAVAS